MNSHKDKFSHAVLPVGLEDPSSLEKLKPPVATMDWDYSVAERGRREHLNTIPKSHLRNVSQAGFSQQQILIASV